MVGRGEEETKAVGETGGGQDTSGGKGGITLDRHEPEAEEESAAAMDADVPQPPGTAQTTEGQPS